MPDPQETIRQLKEAVRLSPKNLPLRTILIDQLISYNYFDEAEQELKQLMSLEPKNSEHSLKLARVYYEQEKNSQALVIVEDLIKKNDNSGLTYMLFCKLMIRMDETARAVSAYKDAVDLDPDLKDEDLEEELGIDEASFTTDEPLRQSWRPTGSEPTGDIEKPKIAFKDVGGMDDVKEEVRMKIIYPLEHREMFESYGKSIGGGILLYGPPGCGKTLIARATAGEIESSFMAIGISDVVDMWVGASERNLSAIFQQAREHNPCVLFFDEVDALGAKRSDMVQTAGKNVINQFLSEMDGVDGNNDGLLILAATNAPWHLDSAFRRPGRFDRIIFVPPPDAPARASILRVMLQGKPSQDVDFDIIAKKTEGLSGADLKAIIDLTIEEKLRVGMKTGKPTPITTADLKAQIKNVKPSTSEWFSTARNYALYSNQGGIYDDIAKYLNLH